MGLFIGMLAVILIIGLVIAIIKLIARWRLFKKAGEKGWKSIIPIWNTYVIFRIADRSFWRWCIPMLIGWALLIGAFAGMKEAVGISLVCLLVSIGFSIWAIVEGILMTHGVSKNFGHGAGYTLGLLFLPVIFLPILAFGSSQYIGHRN